MTLYVDVHEPDTAVALLAQSVPVEKAILNERGWADYKWSTYDGMDVHVERKQWGEVLSGIDKVEDQLRRHKANQPQARLLFILEGLAISSGLGTSVLSPSKNNIWLSKHQSSIRMAQVYSWLYQVSGFLEIFQTPNYLGTCQMLTAMYNGDQKSGHKTFDRHFKEIKFNPNPQVTMLMGLMPGIGEVKAKALIHKYTTVWGVVSSNTKELVEVDGIGPKLAQDILRKIGRLDV